MNLPCESDPSSPFPWRGATAVVGIALALRLAIVAGVGPFSEPDSALYLRVATHLVQTGCLCDVDPVTGMLTPQAYRGPIFPGFVAALMKAFGTDVAWPIALSHALLSTATVAITVAIGGVLGRPRAGIVAGLLIAVSPVSLLHVPSLMSETLYTFLVTSISLAGAIALRWPRWATVAIWGLLAGVGALTRPILTYYGLICLPLLVRVARPPRRGATAAFVWVVAFVAVVAPWIARNGREVGFHGIELMHGVNSLCSTMDLVVPSTPEERRADPALAMVRDAIVREPRPFQALELARRTAGLTPVEADRLFLRIGLEVMRRRPVAYAGRVARNAINNVTSPASLQSLLRRTGTVGPDVERPVNDLAREGKWAMASVNVVTRLALALLLGVVAPLGAWRLARAGAPGLVALIVVTSLYHLVLASAVTGCDRMRLPVEPLLALLVAGACTVAPGPAASGG